MRVVKKLRSSSSPMCWLSTGCQKLGPTGFRVVLGRRVEQRQLAADAAVNPLVFVVPVLAGERPFGPLATRDAILFGRQLLFPLGIGLVHFFDSSLGFRRRLDLQLVVKDLLELLNLGTNY